MTLFSSKTPRDLNKDPWPVRIAGREARSKRMLWPADVMDPRPEFDHVPLATQGPNPVLVEFREYAREVANQQYSLSASALAAYWTKSDEMWREVTLSSHNDEPTGTPEQEAHARRVLERLARLKEA